MLKQRYTKGVYKGPGCIQGTCVYNPSSTHTGNIHGMALTDWVSWAQTMHLRAANQNQHMAVFLVMCKQGFSLTTPIAAAHRYYWCWAKAGLQSGGNCNFAYLQYLHGRNCFPEAAAACPETPGHQPKITPSLVFQNCLLTSPMSSLSRWYKRFLLWETKAFFEAFPI